MARLERLPKISVAMITFNQAPYVEQAILSVLAQGTDLPWELVIGEDCSTDGTREIVRSYAERFPDRVRLLPEDRNVGMNRNLARTISACRGRYIALLEGDDYWTAPHKLDRQARYLDATPNCAICYTNVEMFDDRGDTPPRPRFGPGQPSPAFLVDLLEGNLIPTCSAMFRAGLFGEIPDWFFQLPMGDWPLHVLNAQHGTIDYIDEVMAAYRMHPGGAWSALSREEQDHRFIAFYEALLHNLHFDQSAQSRRQLSTIHYRLGLHHSRIGAWSQSQRHVLQALRLCPLNGRFSPAKVWFMLRKPYTTLVRRFLARESREAFEGAGASIQRDDKEAT